MVRSSDLTGEARLESPIFQELYQQYNIYDTMSMNLAYDHQVMALLTLYRTRADGVFTDQEAFYLRALAGHVNYAYYTMAQREASKPPKTRTMEELVQDYELTRRETEILGLVFQDLNNEEILDRLHISRHTLLKHLQNLYRHPAGCRFPPAGTCWKLRPYKGETTMHKERDLPAWKPMTFCCTMRRSTGSTPAGPRRSWKPTLLDGIQAPDESPHLCQLSLHSGGPGRPRSLSTGTLLSAPAV
ncbi:MAG: LuxR C-terminal-related transcriptional regulator [Evtepia gabavorous]